MTNHCYIFQEGSSWNMLKCKVCGCEFIYSGPRGPKYEAKTCSKECRYKDIGERNKLLRKHKVIEKECKVCQKKYSITENYTNNKTCSRLCHGIYLSNKYAGRKLSKQWIDNQNISKTKEKIIKYGDFTCTKCNTFFETNTSLRAHKSYCNSKEINVENIQCSICKKIFCSRGLKIHMHSHNLEWRNKTTLNLRKSLSTRRGVPKTSKAELAFFENLQKVLGDEVIHKFKIDGCHHEYDICIPSKKIILEFDGDYWHGNKKLFELTNRMKRQYHIDAKWTNIAIEKGFRVIRIWESESEQFDIDKIC